MPAPRKKKVAEPATNDSLAENIQENVAALEVEVEVETALDTIYTAAEGAKTTMNDQVAAVQEQEQEQEQEQVQVTAVQEHVTEQVAAVKEQVAAVKEQVTEPVAAVKEQVAEQVADAKNAIIEMATKSLAETVMSALKPGGKDLKIVISKSASNMISAIASSSPAVLDDIKKSLLEVIKDNKIDSSDIPHLISIIQSLYEIVCNLKEFHLDSQSRASICAEVLKFISHYLILDDQLSVDKLDQMTFLNQIDTLIDSCAGLLSFSSAIKVDHNCLFPFFCK